MSKQKEISDKTEIKDESVNTANPTSNGETQSEETTTVASHTEDVVTEEEAQKRFFAQYDKFYQSDQLSPALASYFKAYDKYDEDEDDDDAGDYVPPFFGGKATIAAAMAQEMRVQYPELDDDTLDEFFYATYQDLSDSD